MAPHGMSYGDGLIVPPNSPEHEHLSAVAAGKRPTHFVRFAPDTFKGYDSSSVSPQSEASNNGYRFDHPQGAAQRSTLNPATNSWMPPSQFSAPSQASSAMPGYNNGAAAPQNGVASAPDNEGNPVDMARYEASQPVQYYQQSGPESVAQNPHPEHPHFQDSQSQINGANHGHHQQAQAPHVVTQSDLAASAYQGEQQVMSPGGYAPAIPQSQSFQSFQSFQGVMSPESTPPPRHGVHVNGHGYFSPYVDQMTTGRLTEPRNYAPRTSGLPVTSEPPPRFELDSVQNRPYAHQRLQSTGGAGSGRANPHMQTLSEVSSEVSNLQLDPNPQEVALSERSHMLKRLTDTPTGRPALADVMNPTNFPFVESAKQAKPMNHGVIKLRNIPFASKRSEIIAFLGRNSKILNDADEGVHIIMEKVTSKTMDAYVEFVTLEDAMKAVERHRSNLINGRLSRLGDRPIDVELSSQANLMKDLFPIARGIFWNGSTPEFKPYNPTAPWENFKGFVSEEEMVMLVKHVEVPHRSPFSRECPQRPYECLISTIKKFPWYLSDHITIRERRAIFKSTCELIRLLSKSIFNKDDLVNLSPFLLRRITQAAMTCPGFTHCMKDDIAWITNMGANDLAYYYQPLSAQRWRHQYALAAKPGIPGDVVEWYIQVIREQTHKDILNLPLRERSEIQKQGEETDMHWGYFWAEISYHMGPQFDKMTLAQAANAEFAAVERILTRAFTPQLTN
ncbi:hypothetical protein PT974_01367 [Cladobotryum mycophilum]|uniref:RRM domain-containing protein n=1 Tax=Cladobotryum mycophilum TaxID=491253 RepID=A0ABR0T3J2_9HYPO